LRLYRVPGAAAADGGGQGAHLVVERAEGYLDLGPLDPLELCPAAELPAELAARARAVERPRKLLPPVDPARVGKILCLGKNFRAHAAEFGEPVPEEPLFFAKLPETIVPHGALVEVPAWYTRRVDHEAELAVLIGRAGKAIAPERALEHVAGYTVANDLTARSLQGDDRKRGHPWLRAKNMDGFCPLGPCLVPRDALDLADLRVTARVRAAGAGDFELRQDASTRDLVVDVPHAVAWLSEHLTLRPGDLILMGTPAGVGPLRDGDAVVCAVAGIGELETRIARPAPRPAAAP
jgi:2-keto-4-pentenoate hydratase/2-oxohepta-3-ene-1,7-dioic acid hydratase in catechol pathway